MKEFLTNNVNPITMRKEDGLKCYDSLCGTWEDKVKYYKEVVVLSSLIKTSLLINEDKSNFYENYETN